MSTNIPTPTPNCRWLDRLARPRWTTVGLAAGLALALTAAGPVALAQGVNLNQGLVLYLTFDEGTGDRAGDASGNLRPAGVHAAPQFADKQVLWTDGRFGKAVDFDGTYFLSVPDYFGIGGKAPRSISLWVNTFTAPSTTTVLVGWGPNVAQQRWHFKFEGSNGAIRTENQGGNNYGSIPVADANWHHVVCVFPEGGAVIGDVNHYVDGVLDPVKSGGLTNPVNTVADAVNGRAVSVGGSPFDAGFRYAITMIDDVRVYDRVLTPEEIAALAQGQGVLSGAPPMIVPAAGIENNPFVDPAGGLQCQVQAVGAAAVQPGGVMLKVNDQDVTAQANLTGGGASVSIAYAGLELNQTYTVEVRATDNGGLIGVRRWSFSTYSQANFVIEAEDYNFGGGKFIDDPVLCNTLGGGPNCYFDRISQPGIDSFDSRGASDDTANFDLVYRYSSSGPVREEQFDTYQSTDQPRAKHTQAGISDYEVNLLNAGDWANYTRQFPTAEAFRILLRARAGARQVVRLERVTTSASGPDQQVVLLGAFVVPASASYVFVPLTDLAGEKALTVKLTGQQTLRLTAVEANNNVNLNYLMFLPAAHTAVLPTVAITAPTEGSVHPTAGSITVRATANDEDGFVAQVSFSAQVNGVLTELGVDTTAPFEVVWPNVPAGVHILTVAATDNDDLVGQAQPVRIVVDSEPPELTSVREAPTLDAVELIFSEPLDPVSAGLLANYAIQPPLALLSAAAAGQRVILTTAPQTAGTTYTVQATNVKDANGIVQPLASAGFKAGSSTLLYGLELYWTFDEGAGPVARDLSGYGRNARVFNTPTFAGKEILWVGGRFGGAVDFDGSYFLGSASYYGIGGTQPRTLSMWIQTDWVVPSGAHALMGWGRNATGQRWHFKLENTVNGALRTENQGGNNFGAVPVNDGQWHHIAAVFPDWGGVVGDVDHYVDAVLDAVKSGGIANPVNTNVDPALAPPVTVGGAPLGTELRIATVVLDDVRLYSRALSLAELEALQRGEGVLVGGPGPLPKLAIVRNLDSTLTLSWTGPGTLQTTTALGTAWSAVPGATSPYTLTPGAVAFFRVFVP